MTEKIVVKSWDEAVDAVPDRVYTLDGVHGRIKGQALP